MYRLKCNNCDQWGFYLQFLPYDLYNTIADTRIIKILPWDNKKIPGIPPFNFCPWCGEKLIMELVGVSKLDKLRIKWKNLWQRKKK